MDDLHQEMFTALLSPDWSHGVEPAVDLSAQNPCDLDLRHWSHCASSSTSWSRADSLLKAVPISS